MTPSVLVTGGTGRLGSLLVPLLVQRGYPVRVLSRRPGAGRVVGDLADGSGVAAALNGIDVVVHAATSARLRRVDIGGTERLARLARTAGVAHLLYVSIVGVDANPFRYYRAKLAAERTVAGSGVPFTLARGTQFYDLIGAVAQRIRIGSLLFAPDGWQVEPVAPADFAAHLAGRVADGPAGGVTEFGGPTRYPAAELVASWQAAHGRPQRVRVVRLPGRVSAAWRSGAQVTGPGAEHGPTRWEDWLRLSERRSPR